MPGHCGLRWQVRRDTALAGAGHVGNSTPLHPLESAVALRSAGAVQNEVSREFTIRYHLRWVKKTPPTFNEETSSSAFKNCSGALWAPFEAVNWAGKRRSQTAATAGFRLF